MDSKKIDKKIDLQIDSQIDIFNKVQLNSQYWFQILELNYQRERERKRQREKEGGREREREKKGDTLCMKYPKKYMNAKKQIKNIVYQI